MGRVIFVDVREPDEFAAGHADGAVNLPMSQLESGSAKVDLPKDAQLVLYCRSGNRSGRAIGILKRLGYANVANGINQAHIERDYS